MLVLGGHGVFGTMIGAAAEAAGWTAIRTSRRPAAGFRHVDLAEPDTLAHVIDQADVIVSTVPDRQVVAERMVLDRGGLLINVSALAASSAAGLLESAAPRGTVVMNAGIAPGLTNLLAAGLLGRHPEADEVELVFTVSLKGSHGPASGEISSEWLTAARRHRTTVIPLPEPYGRRRCLAIAEQQGGWLGPIAAGKTVSTYLCVTERRLHGALLAVNAAGLMSRAARAAASAPVRQETAEPVRHWVAVRRGGALLAASTLRCQGDYRSAAAATVAMADQLAARRDRLPAGLLMPEEALTIDELEPALTAAGITVAPEPAG